MLKHRKQTMNESFDNFYGSDLELTDKLDQPLRKTTVVEILKINLLPEIQHELLYVDVHSVAQ